jgi:RNA polymerase sigma-70 factor (ECF subfamily)
MESLSPDVTVLLFQLKRGDQEVAARLMPLVYNDLRRLAGGYMKWERPDHTLQAKALVRDAYLKLVRQHSVAWQGRSHFLAIAAQLMRRILIDHARGHLRKKRGGAHGVLPLDEALVFSTGQSAELVRLDEASKRLAKFDPRQSKIAELRFFGGLSVEETAEFLKIPPKTVKRTRAWRKFGSTAN